MRVAIAGAGSVGRSIAIELLGNGHEVLLIDKDPRKIKVYNVPRAEWLLADACEISSLEDASLERCNVVIAATGDDKVNLVVSLLAKTEYGVPRVVARINHPNNEWLFNESWGVDVAVSTPRLLSALVEEAVSVGDLVRLMTFRQSEASLVELTMPADAPAGRPADRRDRVAGRHRAGRDPARRPGDRAEQRRPPGGRGRAAVRDQRGRRGGAGRAARRAAAWPAARARRAGALPGLGDLRAALERVRQGLARRLLLELLRSSACRASSGSRISSRSPGGAGWSPRTTTTSANSSSSGRGQLRAARRRAADHAAQEPAGAVHAQEADRLQLPARGPLRPDAPARAARCRTGPAPPRCRRPTSPPRRRTPAAPRPTARWSWARRRPSAGARCRRARTVIHTPVPSAILTSISMPSYTGTSRLPKSIRSRCG